LITYEVRDQFGNAVDPNIAIDETVSLCANPYSVDPNKFKMGDTVTHAGGQATDQLAIGFSSQVPTFCVTLDQKIAVGGSGTVKEQILKYGVTQVAVIAGQCTANDSSCN
jgi:hypothetical protein